MTNNNAYRINFRNIVILNLETFLRLPKRISLLMAYIDPLKQIYQAFMAYRASTSYILAHNSQVVYMRAMLNDSFDPILRRITISNSEVKEPNWLYRTADDNPSIIHRKIHNRPKYIYRGEDFTLNQPDFTVELPIEIQPEDIDAINRLLTEMRAKIDYYKLYSKNYNIVWIS